MKLTDRVYLVGSGDFGFNMTAPLDCHVYLVDGGDGLALIDTGVAVATSQILENVRAEGFAPEQISHILLTHAHMDHAGGTAEIRSATGAEVMLSEDAADFLRTGDEDAINLTFGKAAGFYPEDCRFEPCEVAQGLKEGDTIPVGDCAIEVIDTPGHCLGHLAFQLRVDGTTYLFGGDSVFFGGRIILQNIHDCILKDYIETIFKLAELSVDAMLPGHHLISLKNGQRHLDEAAEASRQLAVPPNLL